MAQPRITILFYSAYGTNRRIAECAAAEAHAAGAEVRLRRVAETAPQAAIDSQPAWKAEVEAQRDIPVVSVDDMEWASGIWISAPTRYGTPASQIRAFIDTLGPLWARGGLADKTFSATASAQNAHGGVEMTIQSLMATAAHWGCVLVPPGYTDQSIFEAGGCPYGFVTTAGKFDEKGEAAVRHQMRRLVTMTGRLVA